MSSGRRSRGSISIWLRVKLGAHLFGSTACIRVVNRDLLARAHMDGELNERGLFSARRRGRGACS